VFIDDRLDVVAKSHDVITVWAIPGWASISGIDLPPCEMVPVQSVATL
jgi:hypothetical protein